VEDKSKIVAAWRDLEIGAGLHQLGSTACLEAPRVPQVDLRFVTHRYTLVLRVPINRVLQGMMDWVGICYRSKVIDNMILMISGLWFIPGLQALFKPQKLVIRIPRSR
jgi:hypothetical protein